MAEIRRPLIIDAGRRRLLAASEILPGASIDQIAGIAPTLDLGFERQVYRHYSPSTGLRSKLLSDIVTFTRASSATYFDATGVMRTAGSNEPRLDFDPITSLCRGVLIEESRTNLFLNSLLDGTSLATQTVTVTAAAHTLSFYGTGSITLSGAHSATITGTSDTARTTLTFTPSAGSLTCTVSGTVKWVNCELGSFATSFIPTAGSTAQRSADVAVISGTAFSDFYRQGVGTLFVEMMSTVENNSAYNRIIQIDDSTSANSVSILHNPTASPDTIYANINDSGGTSASLLSGSIISGTRKRLAFAFSSASSSFTDGATLVTNSTASVDKALSVLRIGCSELSNQLANAPIARIAYWPSRLSNATIQQLAAG